MLSYPKKIIRGVLKFCIVLGMTGYLGYIMMTSPFEEAVEEVCSIFVVILGAFIGSSLVRLGSSAPVPSVKLLVQTAVGTVLGGWLIGKILSLVISVLLKILSFLGEFIGAIICLVALVLAAAAVISIVSDSYSSTRERAREAIAKNDKLTDSKYNEFRSGQGKVIFEEELRNSASGKKHSDYFK